LNLPTTVNRTLARQAVYCLWRLIVNAGANARTDLTSLSQESMDQVRQNISVQLHQFQSNYSPKRTAFRVDFSKLEA